MADPDDYLLNAFYNPPTFLTDAYTDDYDYGALASLDYTVLHTDQLQAPMASLPDTPNIRPLEPDNAPSPLQLDVTTATPIAVNAFGLGNIHPSLQLHIEPEAPATMNPVPTPNAPFNVILDKAALDIADLKYVMPSAIHSLHTQNPIARIL